MFAVFNKKTNKQLSKDCETMKEARELLYSFNTVYSIHVIDKDDLIVRRIK